MPALFADPSVTVPILDRLYADPSDFLRRSVANHLNDVSRLDAALAVDVASRWADTAPGVVRHALRTLVEQGDRAALGLLGFSGTPGSCRLSARQSWTPASPWAATSLTKRTLGAGDRAELTRRHSFREITTRRHHPGEHAIELQVNGHRYGRAEFTPHQP